MALVALSALGLQPQPHVCHPTQLHRACTRMDEAALIDDKPLTAPARVKRVTLIQPPRAHTQQARVPPSVMCALRDVRSRTAVACTQALTFWSKVVPILGAYKAVDLSREYGESLPAGLAESLNLPLTEEAAEARYEELHNWGSERLETTIQELKGFYVKTGQVNPNPSPKPSPCPHSPSPNPDLVLSLHLDHDAPSPEPSHQPSLRSSRLGSTSSQSSTLEPVDTGDIGLQPGIHRVAAWDT